MRMHRMARRGDLDGVLDELASGVAVDVRALSSPVQTALAIAAASPKASHVVLTALLDAGADPNADSMPLLNAVGGDSLAKVNLLLAAGADPLRRTPGGYAPLTRAAACNGRESLAIVRALLAAGADPNVRSAYGESPLSVASHRGRFDVVRLLVDAGADASVLGWTTLHRAAAIGDDAAFDAAMTATPDLDARDAWSRTPLAVTAMTGDVARVRRLCEAGSDPNAPGRCGRPLLTHACAGDHVAAMRELVARGADPLAHDDFGRPALDEAIDADALACVAFFLSCGAGLDDVQKPTDSAIAEHRRVAKQFSPPPADGSAFEAEAMMNANFAAGMAWHAICGACSTAMLDLLLAAGASIDQIDAEGDWPLKRAAEDGDLERVRLLLDRGANIDQTSTGATALHAAVMADELDVATLLLDHGANVDAADLDGLAPLFAARSPEMASLLLARKTDTGARSHFGRAIEWIEDEETRALVAEAIRERPS